MMYYFALKIKKNQQVFLLFSMKIFSSHKIKEKAKDEATVVKLFQQKRKK